MNIFRNSLSRVLALAAALPLLASFLAACDVDSTDSTTAVVSDNSGTIYSYAGLYMRDTSSSNGNAALVYPEGQQSGIVLTWMRLLQYGSVLEAYDNADQNWSGSISAQNGAVASFSLSGKTSAGASVEIVGTLTSGSSSSGSTNGATQVSATTATMDASWLETGFSGTIIARATTSPATVTSNATKDISISPTSVSLDSNTVTQVFTASGGNGTNTWTLSSTKYGTLSATSGSQVTYTASNVVGTVTITVTDSSGDSASATATYSGSTTTDTSTNSTSALKISPSGTLNLDTNKYIQVFTASGGTASYTWNVASANYGTLSSSTGAQVTYTNKSVTSCTNTVTVTDTDGSTAATTVIFKQ